MDGSQPIAIGRLRRHSADVYEIGGFWTRAERRGEGLAGRLVRHTLGQIPPDADGWCLSLASLADYYCSFGLERPPAGATVPDAIRLRTNRCDSDGHVTVLLRVRR